MPEIPGMMTNEAKRYFLSIAFMGDPVIENLWVGLARRPPIGEEVTLDMLTALEAVGDGYYRQQLKPQSWRFDGDLEIVSQELIFINPSSQSWEPLEVSFLATSRDDSGLLLGWSMLPQKTVIFQGDRYQIPIRMRMPE